MTSRVPFDLARLSVALLLGGCAPSEDPTRGGFLAGVHGVASGAYERRLDAREAGLEQAQAVQRTRETQVAGLAAEQRALAEQITAARAELGQLEAELAQLREAIAARQDAAAALELQRVEGTLARVRLNRAEPQTAPASDQEAHETLDDLLSTIAQARALVAELAR